MNDLHRNYSEISQVLKGGTLGIYQGIPFKVRYN